MTLGLRLTVAAGSTVSDEDAYVPFSSDDEDPRTATLDEGDLGSATPAEDAPALSMETPLSPWMVFRVSPELTY